MAREIKFRVWSQKRLEWIHAPGDECNILGEMILLGGWCRVPIAELNDLIVLQYTGLKDRDGKYIYEGDILEWEGPHEKIFTAEVIYNNHKCRFEAISDFNYNILRKESKVIGNIFENKIK